MSDEMNGRGLVHQLGISEMPWVVRAYLTLFFALCVLLVAPAVSLFDFTDAAESEITQLAGDGLKLVLGAVLGSLSLGRRIEVERSEGGVYGSQTLEMT